jgi:3,4-dihydroxy 2-butanone 4-phosphate synthase/GTP cyclohydrolase II
VSTLARTTDVFADGELVLVGDDRDQTLFLACAADHIDAARLERLQRLGRGMVVLGVAERIARRLALPAPWDSAGVSHGLGLTAPIDAAAGIAGGWSSRDRARTMQVASDPTSRPSDLTIPGHVYTGLIEERPGNAAAAAIELARLSGHAPAVALSAVIDRHGGLVSLRDARSDDQLRRLHVASPAELQSGWLARQADELAVSCALPTRDGMFRAVGYGSPDADPATVALIHGKPTSDEFTLVHVHIACLFGDAFGSLLCNCRRELDQAASTIIREGAGVIIYAKPAESAPFACARSLAIDPVLVAGLLRTAGVRRLRLLDSRDDPCLRDGLETCGLAVAD